MWMRKVHKYKISKKLQMFLQNELEFEGISGKKLSFASLPYKFTNGFAVESAGMLSQTAKATLFMSKLEKGRVIEFGKKDVDIFQINNLLASKILPLKNHN